MDSELRGRLVKVVAQALHDSALPTCRGQKVKEDTGWWRSAGAAVDALGIEATDGWESFTAGDGYRSVRVSDDLFHIRAAEE